MRVTRIKDGEATIALHLNPEEETALRKALKFALEVGFEHLEMGIDLILEDEEQNMVTEIFTKLWPNEGGRF